MIASVDTIYDGEGEDTSASINMLTEVDEQFVEELQAAIHATEAGVVSAATMARHVGQNTTCNMKKGLGTYDHSSNEIRGRSLN